MSIYLGEQPIAGIVDTTGKANTSLNNLTSEGEKHFLNKTQITNCITEIPQDIKLELNEGVLTLKAGSKVYVPNGFEQDGTTPKFDVVTIENDTILTDDWGTANSKMFLFYKINGTITRMMIERCDSGSTMPSTTNIHFWYDTTNNVIKSVNSGSVLDTGFSLPLAIFTAVGDNTPAVVSVDQVFNGFGYIGSTIFVLPGVKGLIPNGRNDDGTLNNIEYTTSQVLKSNPTMNARKRLVGLGTIDSLDNIGILTNYAEVNGIGLDKNKPATVSTTNVCRYFAVDTNIWYYTSGSTTANWTKFIMMPIGYYFSPDSKISKFHTENTVDILKRSDRAEISGWSMPSSKYIDLTLGSSGTTYTAPGNGWICLAKSSGGAGQYIDLVHHNIASQVYAEASSRLLSVYVPVEKGGNVTVRYTVTGSTNMFKFIYAEGEN